MYKSALRLRGVFALRLISIVLLYALCVCVFFVLFCIVSWLNMFLALYLPINTLNLDGLLCWITRPQWVWDENEYPTLSSTLVWLISCGKKSSWIPTQTVSVTCAKLIVASWCHRSGSTLGQVKACCLTAPSHYLNQYWLIFGDVKRYSLESDFTTSVHATILYNEFPEAND